MAYFTSLHCTTLHCTVLYCTALHSTKTSCIKYYATAFPSQAIRNLANTTAILPIPAPHLLEKKHIKKKICSKEHHNTGTPQHFRHIAFEALPGVVDQWAHKRATALSIRLTMHCNLHNTFEALPLAVDRWAHKRASLAFIDTYAKLLPSDMMFSQPCTCTIWLLYVTLRIIHVRVLVFFVSGLFVARVDVPAPQLTSRIEFPQSFVA